MTKLCVQQVPLFQRLPYHQQEQIEHLLQRRQVSKGELLIAPTADNQLVILEQGTAHLYQLTTTGTKHIQRLLKAGDYVGETWLLGTENTASFVEATANSTICILSRHDFTTLLNHQPQIAIKLLEGQAHQINALRWQNQLLAMPNIEERLLTYIKYQANQQDNAVIALPLKLKDLASYLGTTPESISRKLVHLEQTGIIERHHRKIKLL